MKGGSRTESYDRTSLLTDLSGFSLIFNLAPVEVPSSVAKQRGEIVAVEGQMSVEGQPVTIRVGLDSWFPQSLPLVFLVPWDALGFIPHVETDGYVCYAQKEGLLLNRRDPRSILEDALIKAASVLSRGFRGENKWDFVDEFEAYWRNLNDIQELLSVVTPDDCLREITVAKKEGVPKDEWAYVYLTDDAGIAHTFCNDAETKQLTYRNALYIPLTPGTFLMPPLLSSSLKLEFVQEIVNNNLSKGGAKKLKKMMRKFKRDEIILYKLPRPSGGEVIFGALFEGVENKHPLSFGSVVRKITPLAIKRGDKTFLLPRGGASTALQTKRVALLGCGSVGGFLAFELARSGVLDLTLVDNDIFTIDNTFRHVLGKAMWGKAKAEGLREKLQQEFPYVRVSAIKLKAEEALSRGIIDPGKFSLIIGAIGDDTISLFLNEKLHGKKGVPPILYTWLEPFGVGGHVLVTGNRNQRGCFECLFTPVPGDYDSIIHNRAAFVAPNQSFSKDISGCANRFTPYASHDAGRTAALASRLAIQVLLGQVSGNPLVSWKGDAVDLLEADFKLSPRYRLSEEQIYLSQYTYQADNCPVCGMSL